MRAQLAAEKARVRARMREIAGLEAEVEMYLGQDAREAVQNSERLFPGFRCMPSAAQLVLANMMFNLGYGG